MIDFVNLKIKSDQSFRGAYRSMIYVHMFDEWLYVYEYLCLYCVSKKKNILHAQICK
jgi:hypothetical protein